MRRKRTQNRIVTVKNDKGREKGVRSPLHVLGYRPCRLWNAREAGAHDQTSSSSSVCAAGVLALGASATRSLSSISLAAVGLSLRYWRALSLPWPMRSPP